MSCAPTFNAVTDFFFADTWFQSVPSLIYRVKSNNEHNYVYSIQILRPLNHHTNTYRSPPKPTEWQSKVLHQATLFKRLWPTRKLNIYSIYNLYVAHIKEMVFAVGRFGCFYRIKFHFAINLFWHFEIFGFSRNRFRNLIAVYVKYSLWRSHFLIRESICNLRIFGDNMRELYIIEIRRKPHLITRMACKETTYP